MRCVVLAALVFFHWVPAAGAVDLGQIERAIGKLPELSPESEFCLLVFGPEAGTRVWLVHDGDALYVDRNGNGDLTEPGERVQADPHASNPEEAVFLFRAGDIPDGDSTHTDLRVMWMNVDHMKDSVASIKERLAQDSDFRGCRVSIDMAMPGYRGRGPEGRVSQSTLIDDRRGALAFGEKPEDAPMIHFGGPWTVTIPGKLTLHSGQSREVYLVMGTPGLGPGTTAAVAYQGVVPEGLRPRLAFTFPSADGSSITQTYELSRRCCQVNLYGDVAVPEEAIEGNGQVEVTLPSWTGAQVASSTHPVTILPATPGPKQEPVSPRLVGKLEHVHPGESICAIQFSPDGELLVAGDYPGGIVHVWELSTGRRRTTVETGEGFRASVQYFDVTPDWKKILAPTNIRGSFERFRRDGKTLNRVTYDEGAIRVWDLDSGALTHTWRHEPPRNIRWIALSPGGRWFLSSEEVPGEYERSRPRALSLWETASGDHRQVAAGNAYVMALTGDGRLAAASIPRADDEQYYDSIRLYELPEWKEAARIALGELQNAMAQAFADDDQVVIGSVTTFEKRGDWRNRKSELKFWSVASGEEILSIPPASNSEAFMWVKASPDGRTVAATTFDTETNGGRVLLVDVPTRQINVVSLDATQMPREPVFHPSGKWMAVAVQVLPKGKLRGEPPASELPQPRIRLIEVATGSTLEELVAPQTYLMSMTFSPDGKTLATSGTGEVLLWDFHAPPGQLGTPPAIGQPLEIEGTLVGGEPLDASRWRGKVVLVSYWATWCRPCVAEMPDLKQVYRTFHERGFDVVGVSLDDHDAKIDEFVASRQIPWAVVSGTSAENSGMRHPMAVKYAVDSVPKSYLLDRRGKVAAIDPTVQELPQLLEELLGRSEQDRPE